MWDAIVAWFQSPGGARVLQTAIIPALAILVAGLLAALIARSAVRATLRRAERVEAASAVAGLVAAARTAADTEGDPVAKRRAVRLRAEADVRTRLLPLVGADLAADWASARTDAIQLRSADAPVTAELAELRDRLVEWVGKPGRAKRIFTAPVPPAPRAVAPEPVAAPEPEPAPVHQADVSVLPDPEPESADKERFARPGPRRTPQEPEPAEQAAAEPERELEPVGAAPAAAAVPPATAPPAAASADALPAWQRTRAVERLQQERGRTRGVEAPTAEEEPAPLGTASVQLPRPHRADGPPAAPAAEAEEAVRLEAHQQARHARPDAQAPSTGAVPAATPTPAPAWLDTYDDEAQVTQNLDLKTPPPVSASAVRDRGAGDDLVPRS